MKTLKGVAALWCVVAIVLGTTSAAQADDAVTIRAEVSWSPGGLQSGWTPDYVGPFDADGAIDDSGFAEFLPWTPTSALWLDGAKGQIRIVLDNEDGWFLESGTGEYAYLDGGGSYVWSFRIVEDAILGETWIVEFELQGHVRPVENVLPQASLVVASIRDLAVDLDASASADPDGSVVLYEWDLDGDGAYDLETAAYPWLTHTYEQAGTYTIVVRITDERGGTDTAAVRVTVEEPAPPPDDSKGGGKGKGGKGKK